MSGQREVVVTGIGLFLPGCSSRQDLWRQLKQRESQLQFEPHPAQPQARVAVGRIQAFTPASFLAGIPESRWIRVTRELQLYVSSIVQARFDAGLDRAAVDPERVGLFDGSSRGNLGYWYDLARRESSEDAAELYGTRELMLGQSGFAPGFAAAVLGTQGPAYAYSNGCVSGAVALGHAWREVRAGRVDVAYATGHDLAVLPPVLRMYHRAGLLSREGERADRAVRPFGGDTGNAFGEGVVSLVLEAREHAQARGARVLAELAGYAYGNWGAHPTDVDPTGARPSRVIQDALAEAAVAAAQVGFVVPHGNGVPGSDRSELAALERTFGPDSERLPLVCTKPIYGHTLGASSMLNVAAAVLVAHQAEVISAVPARLQTPDAESALPPAPLAPGRSSGLALSYAIGGHTTAIVVKRAA